MTETADKQIEALLDKALKAYFSDLSIMNYKEFLASDRRNEFLWLTNHQDYAPKKILDILIALHAVYVRDVLYDTKHFNDESLVSKISDNNNVIYQGYKNRGVSEKLRELVPQSKAITLKKTKKTNWKQHVAFMESFGIPNARQVLIDNKVKLPKQSKAEAEIVGHTHVKFYEHDVIDLDEVDENVIRCDTAPILDVVRYAKMFKNPYTFVRNAEELDDYDGRDWSDWVRDIPNIVCPTTQGAMTISEIVDSNKEYIFCEDYQEEYSYFFKDEKRIIILGSNALLPMAVFLNPNLGVKPPHNAKPENEFPIKEFHKLVEEKYEVSLNSDADKKFFCANMHKIPPCFHTLFAQILKTTDWQIKDSAREKLWNDMLELVLEYKPIDGEDEIVKLLFYYGEYSKIAKKESLLGDSLEYLFLHTKQKINNNEFLKARFVKEVVLPKIFGHIEFRSWKKQELSYGDWYDVSLATHDNEFSFKDDMEICGFSLSFRGLKIRINKGYCSVTLSMGVSD